MESRSSSESIKSTPEASILRILLIEDNPADVAMVREVLNETATPYSMTVASDGETAMGIIERVRKLQDTRPDLILLDINLPKRSGFEVLQRIRSNPVLDSTAVNMLTSSESEMDVNTAYRLGANAYTLKQPDLDRTYVVLGRMFRYWFAAVPNGSTDQLTPRAGE